MKGYNSALFVEPTSVQIRQMFTRLMMFRLPDEGYFFIVGEVNCQKQ